jgi:hypothetical protein
VKESPSTGSTPQSYLTVGAVKMNGCEALGGGRQGWKTFYGFMLLLGGARDDRKA